MDFEDIGNKLANLTMYDVKQFYTAAKNYALNVSEIEAKVNEATNDDAWGASSTLMQEIASATNNFQDFNEIMPAIYRNFMEREAREWRQIYKALQLLEYIIKHGSERVVDDARSHLGTIKILRNFHYIDDAGKDQGINVRNRAKEIAELLSDVERIRLERRKARQNKSKYQGAGNSDFVPGSGTGRYGGFGSDSFYSGGGGGGSGAYGGGSSSAARGSDDYGRRSTQRDSFEAYDAGDDEYAASSATRPSGRSGRSGGRSGAAPAPVKKEEKVADLFSFDDDEPDQAPVISTSAAASVSKPSTSGDGFDDFDDFQAAPSAPAPAKQTKPVSSGSNVFDFLGDDAGSSAPVAAPKVNASFTSPSAGAPLQPQRTISSSSVSTTSKPAGNGSSTGKTNASINFDDLWATSSGKSNASGNTTAGKGKMTMAEMAAQKSQSAVWGNSTPNNNAGKAKDPFDFLS
ncbi:ENTH-domain-containing protein [Meira miltonrushii]|uniref:ENTH-domain-containing protein n=1 Tax=Meira miltonrushii TaxID=1280837 RepID=A0A316VIY7_9BASI|nr:ENTH-domain-containing protein [Meira miltonrushii]PWN37572.1 ENTH-domain-containing protein [Meira miltonrushii]